MFWQDNDNFIVVSHLEPFNYIFSSDDQVVKYI